ncbi:MAG: histone deacetylase [Acidobacteriota bacterium]
MTTPSPRRIGILWDRVFLEHDTGSGHPERPERLKAIKEGLDSFKAGAELIYVKPREATEAEMLRVHTRHHLGMLAETEGTDHFFLDGDTPTSRHSFRVARMAAGGSIELVKAVLDSEVSTGFAFPRPPGHHAEAEGAMGFCLINNVAVAAAWASAERGLKRVAIVDFDVHHGNGTQHIFYDRREILYISSHRFPFYPGTGSAGEVGKGPGLGFTVNVPLPGGCGDPTFELVYDRIICPILEQYAPELVLVSAGFDIYKDDPLGGMDVSAAGFGMLGAKLRRAAEARPGGKIVFVLEGGYSLDGLRQGTLAVLDALSAAQAPTPKTSVNEPSDPTGEIRVMKDHLIPEIWKIQAKYWKTP